MNALLFTDPHFTDNPIEEYRWAVFKSLQKIASEYGIDEIFCLGDVADKKDRHSSVLINRLIDEFSYLQVVSKANVTILSGNHDAPLIGPYYWKFLNILGIRYIQEPELYRGIYLLPFAANPIAAWADLPLNKAKMIFMHQTGMGAVVENDRELEPHPLPNLPVPTFSGDVHRQQEVGGIVYVGAPHPVRFSEPWENRAVVILNDGVKYKSVPLNSIRRAILDIKSSTELEKLDFKKGDQLRIRYHLTGKQLTKWPTEQEKIKQWAKKNNIYIASVQSVLIGDGVRVETNEKAFQLEVMKPEDVVRTFGADEKLSDDLIRVGTELVKNACS